MKIMKSVFGALSHITKVPKFPAEGEHIRFLYFVDYAFDKAQPDAMLALLKYLNNISIDMRQDYLMAITDPEDDLLAVMKKAKTTDRNLERVCQIFRREPAGFQPILCRY